MRSIPESNNQLDRYENFLEKMPDQLIGFPAKILSLIEKYFGYESMMFFPVHSRITRSLGKIKSDVYRNFVTLNMSHEAIRLYRTNIRYIDIFDPKGLPDNLKEASVLFTTDIMSEEEYHNTAHYEQMHSLGLERQACINLSGRIGETLAKIVIFRNEKENAFSEEDRIAMRWIANLVGVQYRLLQNASDEAMLDRGFDLLLKSSQIGAIVVNHRLTVIQVNRRAFELTEAFVSEFRGEHAYVLRNNRQMNDRFRLIQEMIDWVGLDLISNGVKEYNSISKRVIFNSSSFSFIDGNGDVEINHLILFYMQEKKVIDESKSLYERLTPREQADRKSVV